MGTGMIESMLEPHLKDTAGASQTEIGITFMIYAIVYTVAGLGAGYVRAKIFLDKAKPMIYFMNQQPT